MREKTTPTSKRNLGCSGEGEVTMVMVESIHLCGFPTRVEATPLLWEKMAGEEDEEEVYIQYTSSHLTTTPVLMMSGVITGEKPYTEVKGQSNCSTSIKMEKRGGEREREKRECEREIDLATGFVHGVLHQSQFQESSCLREVVESPPTSLRRRAVHTSHDPVSVSHDDHVTRSKPEVNEAQQLGNVHVTSYWEVKLCSGRENIHISKCSHCTV